MSSLPCVYYSVHFRETTAAVQLLELCLVRNYFRILSVTLFSFTLSQLPSLKPSTGKKKNAGHLNNNRSAVDEYTTYYFSCLIIQKSIVLSCILASKGICSFKLPNSKADYVLAYPCSLPLLFSGSF